MNSPQDELSQETTVPTDNAVQDVLERADDATAPRGPREADSSGADAVLENLQIQLRELRQRFDATDSQIAGYLRDKALPRGEASGNGEATAQLQQTLDLLLSKFDRLPKVLEEIVQPLGSSESRGAGKHQEVMDALKKLADHQKELAQRIVNSVAKRMTEELDMLRFQQIVHETLTTEWDRREAEAQQKAEEESAVLADSEADIPLEEVNLVEDVPPEQEPSAEAWSRAIWGPDLNQAEGFAAFRDELNHRLLTGDAGIATLAGQLLVFRQAPAEAKPQLLKDVGEAYYRTRPDAASPDHPFERALITWLKKDCERVGLPNTIEVVHEGERFDKSRHSSTTRGGAEVSEVFGWVVLTEGGRVYTRASVAAQ